MAQWLKNMPAMQETQEIQVPSLGQEDSLERGMAIYSSVLAWKIPWTEEPGGLDTTEVAEHTQHREFSTFPIEC